MTNQTATAELQLNEWTQPRTGETRRYIKNWAEIAGLEIARYNTGNISGAWINDQKIPNARAGAILAAKVWLDESDAVHVDCLSDYAQAYLTEEEIIEAITAALTPAEAEDESDEAKGGDIESEAAEEIIEENAEAAAAEPEADAPSPVERAWDAIDAAEAEDEALQDAMRAGEYQAVIDHATRGLAAAGTAKALLPEITDRQIRGHLQYAVGKYIVGFKDDMQKAEEELRAIEVETPAEELAPDPAATAPVPAMPTTLPAEMSIDTLRTIKDLEAKTNHLNLRAGDIITMADGMDQYLAWGELTQAAGDLLDTLAALPRHGRITRLEERLRAMETRYLREETTIVTDATRRFPEYLAAGPEAARYTSETIAHKAQVLVDTTLAGIDQATENRDNPRGFQTQIMIAHIRANLLRFDCEQLAALWFICPEQALRDRYTTLRDQVRSLHLQLLEANSGPDRLFLNKFAFDHGALLCAMKTDVQQAPVPRGRKLSPATEKFVDTVRQWHPEIKVSIARKMFGLLLELPRFGDEIAGSRIDEMSESEFMRWETVVAIDWVLRRR